MESVKKYQRKKNRISEMMAFSSETTTVCQQLNVLQVLMLILYRFV